MSKLFFQNFKTWRHGFCPLPKNTVLLSVLFLLFTLAPQISTAQQAISTDRIALPSVGQFLASLPVNSSEATRVKSLLNDMHSSIYLRSGEVKNYGAQPLCLFTDVSSLSLMPSVAVSQRNSVEIITIKITDSSDFSTGIGLYSFSIFPNLKYVYIISEIETTPRKIANMVSETKPSVKVFYNILKAS